MADIDYASKLFSGQPQGAPPEQQVDYASRLFSGTIGTAPGLEKPPIAISEPSMGASIGTAFMGGIPTDKQTAVNYFAKQRGISPSRYRVIDGDIAYQADDGKFYKEVSGLGATAAYYAPDVAEMVPDIGAGVALSPLTLLGAPGATAAAAGVGGVAATTNYIRQKIAEKISGQQVDPFQVGLSGLLSAGAELAPVGRQAFVERRLAKDIAQVNPQMVQSLRSKAGQLGIPITPAEITNLSSLMAQQKVLGNVPESSIVMQKFYKEREAKVQSAVDDYLNSLSQFEDRAVAGNRGLQALEVQKQNLIKARDEAVEPIYRSAFEASVPVNTKPVFDQIDNMLKTQPASGKTAAYLNKIKNLITRNDIPEVDKFGNPVVDEFGQNVFKSGAENRLPNLQNAKIEIDSLFKEDAFSSLDRTMQAKLVQIKNNLLEQMGKDNPDYIAANKQFELLSKPINEFNERITGVSLMQMSPDNIKNFANRIFENPSPETIKYAKKQIIAGGGEEAWNAVTRAFLEEQWTLAKKPAKTQQGAKIDTGNTWQNIILGDQKSLKAIKAALPPDQFNALRDLAEVLEATGRVKKLGSDTAFNQLITEELFKNPPMTSITTGAARVVGGIKLDQPAKILSDWAIRKDASANAEQLARIITSPDGISRLKELKKMSPTSAKRWAGTTQLLVDYGILESRE